MKPSSDPGPPLLLRPQWLPGPRSLALGHPCLRALPPQSAPDTPASTWAVPLVPQHTATLGGLAAPGTAFPQGDDALSVTLLWTQFQYDFCREGPFPAMYPNRAPLTPQWCFLLCAHNPYTILFLMSFTLPHGRSHALRFTG